MSRIGGHGSAPGLARTASRGRMAATAQLPVVPEAAEAEAEALVRSHAKDVGFCVSWPALTLSNPMKYSLIPVHVRVLQLRDLRTLCGEEWELLLRVIDPVHKSRRRKPRISQTLAPSRARQRSRGQLTRSHRSQPEATPLPPPQRSKILLRQSQLQWLEWTLPNRRPRATLSVGTLLYLLQSPQCLTVQLRPVFLRQELTRRAGTSANATSLATGSPQTSQLRRLQRVRCPWKRKRPMAMLLRSPQVSAALHAVWHMCCLGFFIVSPKIARYSNLRLVVKYPINTCHIPGGVEGCA